MWYGVDPLTEKYPFNSGYVYCNGNPVKYVDPDGRLNIPAFLIPDASKMTRQEAFDWVYSYACNNKHLPICDDMYRASLFGFGTDYVKTKSSLIAKTMSEDAGAYVNKIIPIRLREGETSGDNGTTGWTDLDLQLSIGSCSFSWELIEYDQENQIATVQVVITDTFDFNPDLNNTRSESAEKLTAIGEKAKLQEYKVKVTYDLKVHVEITQTQEQQ